MRKKMVDEDSRVSACLHSSRLLSETRKLVAFYYPPYLANFC